MQKFFHFTESATMARQLKFGFVLHGVGAGWGDWRHPAAVTDASVNFKFYTQQAQLAEQGRFDFLFVADSVHITPRSSPHYLNRFEPLTILSALAAVTSHIGLVATVTASYSEPFTVARQFASLDHISNGRAGWNVVTTSNPDAALNFGMTEHMAHADRYRRAREFIDVVTGLWDSFEDDAIIRDVEAGRFFDRTKLHVLDHHGEFFNVRGPLNVARPVQGWPVIVQAGASDAGRQLAAETAEAVFTAQSTLEEGQRFYADVKGRMEKIGRDPDHMKILPACFVVVGESVEEARETRALLDSFVNEASSIASLSIALGHDISGYELDGPLPEIPESNASKSARERTVAMARRENLTIRQLARRLGGYSGLAMVGTPKTIADEMQAWLEGRGSDGFNIMFSHMPGGLDDFVDKVVPELQRRGIFRREYEGSSLRENLGLPRPENRFVKR